jgi:hypothetical protein
VLEHQPYARVVSAIMHLPSTDEYSPKQQMQVARHTGEEPRSSSRVDTSAKSAASTSRLLGPKVSYTMLVHVYNTSPRVVQQHSH